MEIFFGDILNFEIYFFCFSGIQRIRTPMLTSKVVVPIEKSIFKEIPCASTLQGEAPVKETINKPSPKPNNDKPKHKKNNVENLGLKLNGLSELQYVLGTFFIDKNM